MAEYCDRDKIIDAIENEYKQSKGTIRSTWKKALDIVCDSDIVEMDGAKPVKYGLWQIIDRCSFTFLRCSVCGEELMLDDNMEKPLSNGYNFCPYCGAEMISEVIVDE